MILFPQLLPLLLCISSFASSSGKVIRFIQNNFFGWKSFYGSGDRSLGFPWFLSAFLLFGPIVPSRFGCWSLKVIVIEKDMAWFVVARALARCMVGLLVAFVMAELLSLVWRSWSERGLRTVS